MLNRITVMGRITKDVELKHTDTGTPVCSFTIAVDRDFKRGDTTDVDFIDIVAWRQTAEFVSKFFGKGRVIIVDGSLQSRKWQDKNGQGRTSWEVMANNAYFGDSKRGDVKEVEFTESDSDEGLPF